MNRRGRTRTSRHAPEQAPTDTEQRYWALVEAMPHGIQECDRDGVITISNPAHAKMHGYEAGELVGKRIWELLDDESEQDELRKYLSFLVSEQPPPTPYFSKDRTKDGSLIDVQADWTYKRDETGNVTGFVSVITDVTARKLAENALRQESDSIQRYLDLAGEIIVAINSDQNVTLINQKGCDLLGCDESEIIGKNWFDNFLPLSDREAVRGMFDGLMRGELKRLERYENDVSTAGGKLRSISWHNSLLTDDAGNTIGTLSAGMDITDRRQAENALREKEAWLESVFASLHECAIIVYDLEGRITALWGTPEQDERYGMRAADAVGHLLTDLLPPAQAARINSLFRHVVETGEKVLVDVPITLPNGDFWQTMSLARMQDAQGEVVGVAGLLVDITERKLAGEALKQAHDELERRVEERTAKLGEINRKLSEEIEVRKRTEQELKLSAEIIENMAEGVTLVRVADDTIVFTNPTFDKIFGYEKGELIGKHASILDAPGDRTPQQAVEPSIATLREKEGVWFGDVQKSRKDGSVFWSQATVSTFEHPVFGEVWVTVQEDISERRNAEQALRRSEKHLRDILDGLFGFVSVCTTDGVLIEANRAPLEAAGLKEEDVIGQPFWETYWWSYSPQVQEQLKEALRRAADGEIVRYDVPVRVADDRFIEIDVRFGPLFDSEGEISQLLGFAVDITDRKQAELALRKSEERLDLAVRGTSDGLWDWKIETGNTYWSPRCKELLGYGEHEIEANYDQFLALLHPDDSADVREAIRLHLEENQPYDCEFRMQTKSGEYRWFQSRGEALRDDNGPYRMAGSIRDITDRIRAEEELREHQERLAHITRLSTMGEMATGLAHELNQPLAAIATYCYAGQQGLADSGSADPQKLGELFEKLSGQAVRSGEIIRRLRALVGKRLPVRSPVNVVEPIQEVMHLLESDLRQSEVHFELHTDHSSSVAIIDEIQIQQVLVNLIRNALDAMSETDRDQRTLNITTSQRADGLIEVAVCDTGEGVPAGNSGQVFDAFFSTKTEGLGMGLAISRTIIESHGGRLWMSPNSDRGVTVHFTLPIANQGSGHGGG